MAQTSIVRAAVVVALAAILDATLAPYLTLGWVAPRFTLLAVVFAASGLRELPAVLLGFFGGILIDALGGGLFGVGALGGLVAGILASRTGAARRKGAEKFLLAQIVAVSVAAYDLAGLAGARLAELEAPPIDAYMVAGVLPDALLNGILAYMIGGWMLALVRQKEDR